MNELSDSTQRHRDFESSCVFTFSLLFTLFCLCLPPPSNSPPLTNSPISPISPNSTSQLHLFIISSLPLHYLSELQNIRTYSISSKMPLAHLELVESCASCWHQVPRQYAGLNPTLNPILNPVENNNMNRGSEYSLSMLASNTTNNT